MELMKRNVFGQLYSGVLMTSSFLFANSDIFTFIKALFFVTFLVISASDVTFEYISGRLKVMLSGNRYVEIRQNYNQRKGKCPINGKVTTNEDYGRPRFDP